MKGVLTNAFNQQLRSSGVYELRSNEVEILQINLGKMCNQTCDHCHVDAGPNRKEIMTRETMLECLTALSSSNIKTVDLTGGAPEMNPNFKWFVGEVSELGSHIIVRSNLTYITSNPKHNDLPKFFALHGVEVISSLPCYIEDNTDKQRGKGVFNKSIEALKLLNEAGYGIANSGLKLHLVNNPIGPYLPPDQKKLAQEYKKHLGDQFSITFNELYTITNMPINRFKDYLEKTDKLESYMDLLIDAFNPKTITGLMCINTVSVSWDGFLYDCDFNQMLGMKIDKAHGEHIKDFEQNRLEDRMILTDNHCYGCTAGCGSSCQGAIE